jgi:hypothetical protein
MQPSLTTNKLQKIVAVTELVDYVNKARHKLLKELVNTATDDTIFMRRFRILQQLSYFESTAIKKIYCFNTHNTQDYHCCLQELFNEVETVISRDG